MIVWSLFDGSGLMAQPWAEVGHTCYCFNYDGADHGDYARLGAKVEHENIHYINAWIDNKFNFDVAPDIIFAFNPYEYGGYLHEDDTHPMFPDVIPARDAYAKKTCLWAGNGFVMPDTAEVAADSGITLVGLNSAERAPEQKQSAALLRAVSQKQFTRLIMSKFQRREYQKLMTSFMLRHNRCNIWASMGAGKTGSVLWAINRLFRNGQLNDDDRVLILAPLRVASGTWPAEQEKWNFPCLSVIDATGSEKRRIAALESDANVVCTNYEVIEWLIDYYGKDDWPFTVIVADESTKLKSFRSRSGGSKRAKALSKVAFGKVKRFINLTGTPSPNGLKDLWGQNWFIDAGERLGSSYTAFTDRWFNSVQKGKSAMAREYHARPGADNEIHQKMKDISLTIDAAEWFGCEAPIIVPVEIDLPKKARQAYIDMEEKLFAELESGEVEAANAAAKTSKCLQIASGAVYVSGPDGEATKDWEKVHDTKLDALESIVEELQGAPLLVAYQFKHELERILKRFPQAQAFAKGAKGNKQMEAWNRGEIEILCVHPASAGHGLNLQDGGHHLAFISQGWNLEHYLQVVERIGPVRQKQAGHERPVFLYHIVAKDTLDEVVAARTDEKKSVQEELLNYMKRRGKK